MIKTFHQGIATLAKCFNIDTTPLSKEWARIYDQRLQSRGKQDAVKFMKELNTVAERYALHQVIKPIPWTRSDNDNYPVILNKFKTYLRSQDSLTVMFTISVFRTVEILRLPISKDISTVTDPCRSDPVIIEDIIKFIPIWLKRLPSIKLPKMNYHLTAKNGPNGHALMTSDADLEALMNCDMLFNSFKIAWNKQADSDPSDPDDIYHKVKSPIHSKLTQFPEKAGKTRTIAIIDYYSQRMLNPLHKGLMHMLSNLVSDGTYSHMNVGRYAEQLTKEKSFIACADLTAATDRFPALIQEEILHELIKDRELSTALWTLLAKRTFTVAWSGDLVTYACGQPMGSHASWPLFALAHHLIVEYAGYSANIPNVKARYRLIGDDVIISDEKLWQNYEHIMLALGLTINEGKTVLSPSNSNYSGAEVAKQLYLNGSCLTPLTPGFIELLKKPHMFNTCMWTLRNRYGESVSSNLPPMLIDRLYRKAKTKQLVWLLSSNPMTGYIKPGNPGYDLFSPWDAEKSAEYIEKHYEMLANILIESATREIQKYLPGQGGPWEDLTHPQPHALKRAFKATLYALTDAISTIKISFFNGDIVEAVAKVPFVPNPGTPYMEKQELVQKRTSSLIVKLYNLINK